MATMTLRGIDDSIADALKKQAKLEGISVNALMLRLLKEKLGLEKARRCMIHKDLDHLAGTWTEQEAAEFEQATAAFGLIDDELWRRGA